MQLRQKIYSRLFLLQLLSCKPEKPPDAYQHKRTDPTRLESDQARFYLPVFLSAVLSPPVEMGQSTDHAHAARQLLKRGWSQAELCRYEEYFALCEACGHLWGR